ncbi:UPF0182 family protein [Cyanobium sp. LEGE 06143]|uniref:UPF0182 family protein n=1 Tax=Cyanobium sp. LEGE 06143 TaxID=945727 RepID=UPI00187FC433|nr:UPF0182 family protein [Cyanobium sp. LEGE 06143]
MTRSDRPAPRGRLPWRLGLPLLLLAACLAAVLASRLWVEWSWFSQFSLDSVLLRRWGLQLLGLGLGLGLTALLQAWLLWFWRLPGAARGRLPLPTLPYGLLLLVLLAGTLVPLALVWGLTARLAFQPFDPQRLHGLIGLAGLSPGPLLLAAVVAAVLLGFRPEAGARLLHAVLGLGLALVLGRGWGLWSLAVVAEPSGIREPLLGADVSFVLLRFPALALALTLALALVPSRWQTPRVLHAPGSRRGRRALDPRGAIPSGVAQALVLAVVAALAQGSARAPAFVQRRARA